MSPTLDYGDFNRFLVSLGIGAILASVGAPVLLSLGTTDDVQLKQTDFDQLTAAGQEVVNDRLAWLQFVAKISPFLSGGPFALGVLLVLVGSIRWVGRQRVSDAHKDEELRKIKYEVSQMTLEERSDRIEAEARQDLAQVIVERAESGDELDPGAIAELKAAKSLVASVHRLEDRVASALSVGLADDYEVMSGVRIGDRLEADFLIRPKGQSNTGLIIELKYTRTRNAGRVGIAGAQQLAAAAASIDVSSLAALLAIVMPSAQRPTIDFREPMDLLTDAGYRRAEIWVIDESQVEEFFKGALIKSLVG